ncbi:MAG: peptide chain release factor N(5)-glutamine methyltransferase [Syntrophotaleaceae bacterium]
MAGTKETWTVLKVLQWTADYLKDKGVDNGRLDAELMLAEVLKLDRVGLYLNYDRPLDAVELSAYRQMVGRRSRREPLQYILGRTEFWSLPFEVTPAVLIPRPDTEVMVEEALARVPAEGRILDVGTGSGAIAVALAHELPKASLVAIDTSAEALAVAANNAERNGLAGRIEFQQIDMVRLPDGPFDLIVANPPYIPTDDLAGLMPEVRAYEPSSALDGGEDGLDCYRLLAGQAGSRLRPGGWLLVEAGIGQVPMIRELFEKSGLKEVFSRDDYGGIPRVVGGRRI